MIEINLFPVRAARKKETMRFQISIFFLVLILVFALVAYLKWDVNRREKTVDTQIASVQKELEQLKKEVGEVERLKQDKAKLQQKLDVIGQLEKGRLSAAHILDELSQQVPEKIWIETLEKQAGTVKITGVALDNETIANFMKDLERSPRFGRIDLDVTEQITRSGLKLKKFILNCSSTL